MNWATGSSSNSFRADESKGEMIMRKVLLLLTGAAVALTTAPAASKTYVCTKWRDGICVSTHRVKGRPAFQVGYVCGPNYAYSTLSALPAPVVTYDSLTASNRYVYSN